MKPKYLRGAPFLLGRLRCWAYIMRRMLFQKSKYPMLNLTGLKQAARMMDHIGIDRWIEWRGAYRQHLITPMWPSPVYDHMLSKGGLNVDTPGDVSKRSWIDLAMVCMTRHCSIGSCRHCSERHNLGKEEVVPLEKLHQVVKSLQDRGTCIIAFTGGEPFDRPERLLELIERGDKNRSEFRVYTTGKGVTAEWAQRLEKAGLSSVLISIDGYDSESHDQFRRKKGVFNQAIEAMQHFMDAGVFVFANVTLSRELVQGDGLYRLWEGMKELGVPAIQMIEPKTCGGYFKDALPDLFNGNDIRRTREIVDDITKNKGDGPVIYWVDEEERKIGCRAGGMLLFLVDAVGNVTPCVFLPLTLGNILEEDFDVIFDRMRSVFPDRQDKGCLSNLLTPTLLKLYEQGQQVPVPYEKVVADLERIYQLEPGSIRLREQFDPVRQTSQPAGKPAAMAEVDA